MKKLLILLLIATMLIGILGAIPASGDWEIVVRWSFPTGSATDEFPFNELEEQYNITYYLGFLRPFLIIGPPDSNMNLLDNRFYPFADTGFSYVRFGSVQEIADSFPAWLETEHALRYDDEFFADNFLIFIHMTTDSEHIRNRIMSISYKNNAINIEVAMGNTFREYQIFLSRSFPNWVTVIEMCRTLFGEEITLTRQNVEFLNPAIGEDSHYVTATANEARNFPEFVRISSVEELAAYYVANSMHISARMREEIFLNPKFNEAFFYWRGLTFLVIEEESSFNHLELTSVEPENSVDWRVVNFNLTRTIPPSNFELSPDDMPRIWHFVVDFAYWVLEPHREFMLNVETRYNAGIPESVEAELPFGAAGILSATPAIIEFDEIQQGAIFPPTQTVTLTNTGNAPLTLQELTNVAGNVILRPRQSKEIAIYPDSSLPIENHSTIFTILTVEGARVDVELRFEIVEPILPRLDGMDVGGGTLSPEFDTEIFEYTFTPRGRWWLDPIYSRGLTVDWSSDSPMIWMVRNPLTGEEQTYTVIIRQVGGGNNFGVDTSPLNPNERDEPSQNGRVDDPTEWENPFIDVNSDDWFYNYVRFAYRNNLMQGISATEFAPNLPTTRAMFVTVLWRLAGSPNIGGESQFVDVTSGTWYVEAVTWAAENGIVLGVGEDLFAPHTSITREQMGLILYRHIGDEVDEIMDRNYVPLNIATRAEVAVVLQRLSEIF